MKILNIFLTISIVILLLCFNFLIGFLIPKEPYILILLYLIWCFISSWFTGGWCGDFYDWFGEKYVK